MLSIERVADAAAAIQSSPTDIDLCHLQKKMFLYPPSFELQTVGGIDLTLLTTLTYTLFKLTLY